MHVKPGDKCSIINSCSTEDIGKIVIVDAYFNGEWFDNAFWHPDCDVIITSLGGVLHSKRVAWNADGETYMTRPFYSKWLRKLPEVKEDVKETIEATV